MITVFPAILAYRAKTHPDRIAYVFDNVQYSYEKYYQQSVQAALYLQSLGIKKGDRIGILDLNNPYTINLISGAMLIGVIPVSLNWRAMPPEILFVLKDAGIQHFFYGGAFGKLIAATPFGNSVKVHKIEKLQTVFEENNLLEETDKPNGDDVCVILYTSGTTGNPKGVMLTYNNIYSCYQLCASDTPAFGPDARNLVCGPLYSIFGFGAFYACIYAGATNILLPMFDATMICKSIVEQKVTNAVLVPVMFRMILAIEGVDKMDFSSLRHVQYGGSPVSGDVLMKISKLFNCPFTQVYGLTETAGVATALRYDDHAKILSGDDVINDKLLLSAGKAGIGIEIKIVDENGNETAVNEPGEVYIKGENIAKGYWNQTQATDKVFRDDDWFSTGDIAYINEEGYLFLVDRKNDMIVSKGVNVYPAEVEKIIEQYPGFREVAVVAVPDEKSGEAICAVAVLKNGAVSLQQLQEWCVGKIAEYKIPKRLEIINELPRNPTGKVLRRLVREPFWKNEQRNIKG